MPIVPRISDERLRTQPIPTVRRQVYSTEETFGGGAAAAKTAEATSKLLDTGQKIILEQRKQADTLAVLEASSKLSDSENRLLYDPKGGAFLKLGKDAFDLPEQVMGDYDKITTDIESGLSNDDQKIAFRRQALAHRASIDEQVQRHVATQIKKYDADSTEAYITNERQAAALNSTDLNRIGLSIGRQTESIRGYAQRNGLPDSWITAQVQEAESKTLRGVIERMIQTGDPRAEDFADSVKDQLLTDDVDMIDKARRQADQQKKLAKDQLAHDLYVRMVDGQLQMGEVKELLRAGAIDKEDYTALESRAKKLNDDPLIPIEQKVAKFFQLTEMFDQLNGAKLKTTGTRMPDKPAKGNRLKQLQEFRAAVAGAADHLTDEQERALLLYTQRDYNAATAAKAGIVHNGMLTLAALGSPLMMATASVNLLGLMAEGVSVEDAAKQAQTLITDTTVAANPNRSKYQIGGIYYNTAGLAWECIGYRADGNPIPRWVKKK